MTTSTAATSGPEPVTPAAPAAPSDRLRPYWPALLLGMLTLLYGFGIGIAFGAAEDTMKGALKSSADAALTDVYGGDAAKAKAVVDKAWTYQKRAHLHAGGLGASSLVLIVLLALACKPTTVTRVSATLLGFGALGYSVFWMLAGFAAPGLGSTDAAKESLAWLALPTSGAVVIGTIATLVLVTSTLARKPRTS